MPPPRGAGRRCSGSGHFDGEPGRSLQQSDCVVLVGAPTRPAKPPRRLMNELIHLRERCGSVIRDQSGLEVGQLSSARRPFRSSSNAAGLDDRLACSCKPISRQRHGPRMFLGLQKGTGWEAAASSSTFLIGPRRGLAGRWGSRLEVKPPGRRSPAACRLSAKSWQGDRRRDRPGQGAWCSPVAMRHHPPGQRAHGQCACHRKTPPWPAGNVGRPGAGTMPDPRALNVAGASAHGRDRKAARPRCRKALETLLGRRCSRVPGYDTRGLLIEAAASGAATAARLGPISGANPDFRAGPVSPLWAALDTNPSIRPQPNRDISTPGPQPPWCCRSTARTPRHAPHVTRKTHFVAPSNRTGSSRPQARRSDQRGGLSAEAGHAADGPANQSTGNACRNPVYGASHARPPCPAMGDRPDRLPINGGIQRGGRLFS